MTGIGREAGQVRVNAGCAREGDRESAGVGGRPGKVGMIQKSGVEPGMCLVNGREARRIEPVRRRLRKPEARIS